MRLVAEPDVLSSPPSAQFGKRWVSQNSGKRRRVASRLSSAHADPGGSDRTQAPCSELLLAAAQLRASDSSAFGYSELSLLTGFPGPVSYGGRKAFKAKERKQAPREPEEQPLHFYGQEVQPVFRSSPFAAEERRRSAKRSTVRILVVDEGNCCRSVIAEAMFNKIIKKMAAGGTPLDICIESASLGPAFAAHDPRVERLARESGLELPPRRGRCFDEVKDMVEYDLVLVMDKFDFEEVMREVSVLDTINPGGYYSARIQQLGHFAAASTYYRPEKAPWIHGEGITDPLYGNAGGREEESALWGMLRKLRLGCAGLAQYLSQLHSRCIAGTSLQQALSQALLCPLLDPKAPQDVGVPSWGIPEKGKGWRPVWRGDEEDSLGQLYSLRVLNGSSYIVKRPDPFYKVERGYWRDIENLRKELEGWIDLHGTERGRLPTSRELRASGANQICNAVEFHGGYHAVAQLLGLKAVKQRKHGHWADRKNLQQELAQFVQSNASGTPEASKMPAIHELKSKGRPDLAYAISRLGGIEPAAELCGLSLSSSRRKKTQSPRQSSCSLVQTRDDLWRRFPEAMQRGQLPSRTELIDSGNKQLAREITDLGGFKAVSAELGLQYKRAGRNTSKQSQAAAAQGLQALSSSTC